MNTNQAFKDWETAKGTFEERFNKALNHFMEDASEQYQEVLRRGSQMTSSFGDDNDRNNNTNKVGNNNSLLMDPNLISGLNQTPGAEDKFFDGSY